MEMEKAIFEVKSIVQHWGPPFGKEVSSQDVEVAEGNSFDPHPKAGNVFKLVKLDGGRALVEFNEKFTLKGHEHPRNRQVWIDEEPVSFTYLWGNDGMTKSLRLKSIERAGMQEEKDAGKEEPVHNASPTPEESPVLAESRKEVPGLEQKPGLE